MKGGNSGSDLFVAKNKEEYSNIKKTLGKQAVDCTYSPWRVKPGGLAVSRSMGDADSKVKERGGFAGVVISEPDVRVFKYEEDMDFILMGTDGVFDMVSAEEACGIVWETAVGWKKNRPSDVGFHDMLGACVNNVMERALFKNTDDNITLLLIIFKCFKDATL